MIDTRCIQVVCIDCDTRMDEDDAWALGAGCYLCPACRWDYLRSERPKAKGEVIRLRPAAEPGADWNDLRPLPDWWRTIAHVVAWAVVIFTPWLVFALLVR
jgi:hypothetical protein